MSKARFTETTGAVAKGGNVSQPTIRLYADLGLLEFVLDSRGSRLFDRSAAARVREIFAERMKNRGRGRSAAAI
jgi:DNA-binding transcriptional MerR regulator